MALTIILKGHVTFKPHLHYQVFLDNNNNDNTNNNNNCKIH